MSKFACPCCGCLTIDEPGEYDICPVCFWEDEPQGDPCISSLIEHPQNDDDPSPANHGISLNQACKNYRKFGACHESMLTHVRKPDESEKAGVK